MHSIHTDGLALLAMAGVGFVLGWTLQQLTTSQGAWAAVAFIVALVLCQVALVLVRADDTPPGRQ